MIKSITNFLIIFFIFQQLKSQISQIDQNGVKSFCDETLHVNSNKHDTGKYMKDLGRMSSLWNTRLMFGDFIFHRGFDLLDFVQFTLPFPKYLEFNLRSPVTEVFPRFNIITVASRGWGLMCLPPPPPPKQYKGHLSHQTLFMTK